MGNKKVTVRDLAQESGFSVATVSRYLNGDFGSMSLETRNILEGIVRDSGYVMKKEKTVGNVIGLVVPNVADPYFGMVIEAIHRTVKTRGFILQLGVADDSFENERQAINEMLDPSVAGILYMSTVTSKENCFDLLKSKGKPFVVFDSYLSELNVPAMVFCNGVYGMYEATRYLVDNGHREIAYLSGLRNGLFEHCRYQGYVNGLLSMGITVNPNLVRFVDFSLESGEQAFDELMDRNEQFTAILCESDLLAAGVYRSCGKRNIRIPDQLSVVGYNNSVVSQLLNPQMTSVDQNLDQMADEALTMLVRQIHGEVLIDHVKMVPSSLIKRESVRSV